MFATVDVPVKHNPAIVKPCEQPNDTGVKANPAIIKVPLTVLTKMYIKKR